MNVGLRHIFIVLLLMLGAQASGVRACGWENFVLGSSCHGAEEAGCGESAPACGAGIAGVPTDLGTDSPCLCSPADGIAKFARPVQSPLDVVCLPFSFVGESREQIATCELSVRVNQRAGALPSRCLPLLI